MIKDLRLIEAGFPCHQVGAETQRERGASSALPPLYFLHVWWARRPLTPSRAAIVASLAPAGTDPDTFVRELGIEIREALLGHTRWTLSGSILERVEKRDGKEVLPLTPPVIRAFEVEQTQREQNLRIIQDLCKKEPALAQNPVILKWRKKSTPLSVLSLSTSDYLIVERGVGDPAWFKDLMAIGKEYDVRVPNLYGYDRAYATEVPYYPSGKVVLDPTSGGGSIPFEALRLGHKVIANELNPVATTILHATLDYPARFGESLKGDIERYGKLLLESKRSHPPPFFYAAAGIAGSGGSSRPLRAARMTVPR